MARQVKKLYRSRHDKFFGGVCGGLAEYWSQSINTADEDTPMLYEIDPVLIRVGWAIVALFGGFGLFAYLACWLIIPQRP